MKINYLKITLALVCTLAIFSCSKDEETINTENEVFEKTTFSTENIYYDILNSENPQESFDNLESEDKALVWEIKYQIFSENTNLSYEKQVALDNLSNFVTQAHINDTYDSEEFDAINTDMISVGYSKAQLIGLYFYIENPVSIYDPEEPVSDSNCFWCNMITDEGPCRMEEYNGHYHVVKTITFVKVRFGVAGKKEHYAISPCNDQEVEEFLTNLQD